MSGEGRAEEKDTTADRESPHFGWYSFPASLS